MVIDVIVELWKTNRERTLATLDTIEKSGQAEVILGWRPGPGRAHIAWQLMHIGITEGLFATERLLGKAAIYPEYAPRFKGGSTPDDDIPTLAQIREVLETTRAELLSTVSSFLDTDLETIPESFRERGWTLKRILHILNWHEGHHQGQAHLTYNLWKAGQPS